MIFLICENVYILNKQTRFNFHTFVQNNKYMYNELLLMKVGIERHLFFFKPI